ncbi:MAG TPA: PilZ domain-containing protein [Bacilli bacterium]
MDKPFLKNKHHYRLFIRLKPEISDGFMDIVSINGRQMQTKQKPVLIDDISPEGLKFTTELRLPVGNLLGLGFHLYILNQPVRLEGFVVWRRAGENLYEYGVRFKVNRIDHIRLIKQLNDLLLYIYPGNAKVHLLYRGMTNQYLKNRRRKMESRNHP